jgi:hypothetical protein
VPAALRAAWHDLAADRKKIVALIEKKFELSASQAPGDEDGDQQWLIKQRHGSQ